MECELRLSNCRGVSSTINPFDRNWLGHSNVWFKRLPKKMHSCSTSKCACPVRGSVHTVPAVAIGIALIGLSSGEYPYTSTNRVGSSSRRKLSPATDVSACESSSQLLIPLLVVVTLEMAVLEIAAINRSGTKMLVSRWGRLCHGCLRRRTQIYPPFPSKSES
jgi:hypothetical protein